MSLQVEHKRNEILPKKNYKVIASLAQLQAIGCGLEEVGAIGEFVKEFPDGWLELIFQNKKYITGNVHLDIPKYYLEPCK